jgi:hypothetical protein
LNQILQGGQSIFNERIFKKVTRRDKTESLRNKNPIGERLIFLNRLLLEDTYPEYILKFHDAVSLTLTSDEAVTRNRDHTISLSLRSVSEKNENSETKLATSSNRSRVLVIEPRPFRVAAVDYDEISGLSTSENNEVAVWNESGEGGLSWRIRDEAQTIDLLLPPQVIGEAMEKNRSGLPGLPSDITPGKPSAARFGSLTALRIDPTYAETRFQEPGWNLRRILGFPLQRNPGAFLRDLRMELLYGLLARIHADDVNITELAGAIGEPPPPLTEALTEEHLKRHAALIDAVLEAERTRLAVEKLWRTRPDDDLRLDGGVARRRLCAGRRRVECLRIPAD